ncbi:MAG: ATP-binding protein, partial [Acidimicrobiales bacterium]
DKASAVVAELIANSYDADADHVWIELPLATELASMDRKTGKSHDNGYEIVVRDDGHGMTPAEAREFYLKVGRDRREHVEQGARSREKDRPVMGRKGIGKLAPFGICTKIEVRSSGGDEVPDSGYLTTHFFLDFDEIVQDTDEQIVLDKGELDATYQSAPGTTIVLSSFLPKRVPNSETFHRQVATRFALADPNFEIRVRDTRQTPPVDTAVEQFQVPIDEETKLVVDSRPITTEDGETLVATGWIAMAKTSYKNEELAGVRIYARGKIVATTRDFEQPAGFTGEYHVRSYLVGEIVADWLDEDQGDDLIRTDRQSILWDSDRGRALREWGAALIKEVARLSAGPRRKSKREQFMEKAQLEERATDRFGDEAVVEAAVKLGEMIGGFAAEDELDDPEYVDGLAEIILTLAPHQALVEAFRQVSHQPDATIDQLITLFGKTRVAEMASYSQIASVRVQAIKELQEVINKPGVTEPDLQHLIASAPWLIRPDWTVLTENQSLKVFRDQFVVYWKSRFGADIDVAISYERKRPDFTLVHHGQMLHVVEIKAPGHAFSADDYDRLQNYVTAFIEFFGQHQTIVAAFSEGWEIDLIADSVNLTNDTQRYAFESFLREKTVVRRPWNDFLASAATAHQEFLDAYEQAHAAPEAGL